LTEQDLEQMTILIELETEDFDTCGEVLADCQCYEERTLGG